MAGLPLTRRMLVGGIGAFGVPGAARAVLRGGSPVLQTGPGSAHEGPMPRRRVADHGRRRLTDHGGCCRC